MSRSFVTIGRLIQADRAASLPDLPYIKFLHPELQAEGPESFNLTNLDFCLDEGQLGTVAMKGADIYVWLKKTRELGRCLGFPELLAFERVGYRILSAFPGFPGDDAKFLFWKTAANNVVEQELCVLALFVHKGEFRRYWVRLKDMNLGTKDYSLLWGEFP